MLHQLNSLYPLPVVAVPGRQLDLPPMRLFCAYVQHQRPQPCCVRAHAGSVPCRCTGDSYHLCGSTLAAMAVTRTS